MTIMSTSQGILIFGPDPFYAQRERKTRQKMYLDLEALLHALNAQWRYAKYREPRNARRNVQAGSLDEIFSRKRHPDYRLLWREYRSRSVSVKSDLSRLARYCAKRNE